MIEDENDDPLFWIALAEMQWTYGGLETPVLERVKDDLASGRSLLAWEEDQRGLARRRAALEKFIAKISVPKPRPKEAPRPITRPPKFRAGDCLSIRLEGSQYTAAIVLAADDSLAELGTNLVAVLDYLSADKPAMEVFLARAWLMLGPQTPDIAWYFPIGFRATKARLEVVGVVEILESDPKDSNTYRRWTGIGDRRQRQADGSAEGN